MPDKNLLSTFERIKNLMWSSLKGKYILAQGCALGVYNDLYKCNPERVEYLKYSHVVMTKNYYSPPGNQIFDVRNTQGGTLGYYIFLLRRNFLGSSITSPTISGDPILGRLESFPGKSL
jgi:hypothetical protein